VAGVAAPAVVEVADLAAVQARPVGSRLQVNGNP